MRWAGLLSISRTRTGALSPELQAWPRAESLTFSITNGVGAGFVIYTLLKLARGRFRELHPLLIVVSIAFVVYFAIEPIKKLLGIS